MEDQVSTQADMAAFAGGASSDEDMLSSLASDVKHIKKDKDISLLRELKDFRAPANEIEQELSGVYERMSSTEKNKKKTPPSITGKK
jgi:predicted  nucleic acid-binding Zn-ribbon protein